MADELLPIIAANAAQREEWVKLFAIDDVDGYASPLSVDFLKNNNKLLVDTKFFDATFKYTLLSIFDNLDQQTDGLLINSENFQALNLLQERYKEKVKCIYIDPPYNSAASEIIYKNGYKHSSWLSLMENRYRISKELLSINGVIATAIDDIEFSRLEECKNQTFDEENHITNLVVLHNPKGRDQKYVASAHEYTIFFAKDKNNLTLNRLCLSGAEILKKYPKQDNVGRYRELPLRRSGSEAERIDRPYMYFPFLFDKKNKKIKNIEKEEYNLIFTDNIFNDDYVNELKFKYEKLNYEFILPIREDNSLGRWRWGYDRCCEYINKDVFFISGKDGLTISVKDYVEDTYLPKSLWFDSRYDASTKGTNLLKNIIPNNFFDYPKSIFTVQDIVYMGTNPSSFVLDYFAGSGTTGHAVINLNREDGGTRKYILVEMGGYFSTVTFPRVLKAAYSSNWKDGKPVSRDGVSHIVKYMSLEQYEDTLNNLGLSKSDKQAALLSGNTPLNEQYMLGYMLDVESRGSQSLLNIDQFTNPFAYTLQITRNDDTETVNVDLVETFNYLIGLTVRTIKRDDLGIVTVTGQNNRGEHCLIIWRNTHDVDNDRLDTWFGDYVMPQEPAFDVIYVNGDNNLENLKQENMQWSVRLIEADFKRLMFDVQDV